MKANKKRTIIRIKKGLTGWGIRKHGSRNLLVVSALYNAIRGMSRLIEDRKSVEQINVEIIRK